MHFRKSLPVSPFLYSAMWIPLKKKKKRKKCAPLATEKWTFHGIAQWLWDISSEQPWNETLIIPHLHRKFSPTLSNQAGLSLACKTCIYRRNCCSYPFVTLEYYSWKRFINRNKLVVVVVRELFEREVFIPFEFSSLPRESLTINNNGSRYWNSFKYNLISREKKIILENV